jgi:hypothetical protein
MLVEVAETLHVFISQSVIIVWRTDELESEISAA